MSNLPVAETILEQLGGRKFIAMTGARNFVGCATWLSFRIPGSGGFAKNGINYVKITLDPSDTYTVDFRRIRGSQVKSVDVVTDIYADALRDIFTSVTGLSVSL